MRAEPYQERFFKKFEPEPNTGCWLWTDVPDYKGYGVLKVGKRNLKAHRISWSLHFGPIPEGLQVCHKCDTPACVNPTHLFIGTNHDNALDRHKKGRTFINPRRTHCVHGHEYTEDNIVLSKRGKRSCRECKKILLRRYYQNNKHKWFKEKT